VGNQAEAAGVLLPKNMARPTQWHEVETRFEALRPRIAAYWARLPAEDVERLPGDRASLVHLVKRIYALQQSGAEAQVDAWLAGVEHESAG
jgi:hypothetical protein